MEQASKSGMGREWDYLEALREERVPVKVYLANGIRLVGRLVEHSEKVLFLKDDVGVVQLVYKQAISTVLPQ